MRNPQNILVAVIIILLIVIIGGGYYIIASNPIATIPSPTSTSTTQEIQKSDTSGKSAQPSVSHVDWTAPGYIGTLVTIDNDSLQSASPNPTISGTAQGFGSLNIGVISNDRSGSAVFNVKPIPVVNGKWSIQLVRSTFGGSGNVFNDTGTVPDGSYNIQISPGPTYVANSLINATMIVDAN
ncbi:MAG: hypothetical protein AB203_02375 [Parcubacteria bacterium C7867-008]|nr:MAG: hypothetical protein AB203_02375 [Parcubacteria bacterium C7867-008]